MAYADLKVGPDYERRMLEMIDAFDWRPFTDTVKTLYGRSFARIRSNLDSDRYKLGSDALQKDYALCAGQLFPAGRGQVVDRECGFARSLVFKGGVRQAISVMAVLGKTGGHDNYYQYHIHLEELEDFNPEGFQRFYRTVAGMLRIHPDVKGLYGGTWFFDPALKEVSPHLAHIRELPEANGARFFFQDVSIDTGALEKSSTRRRLYEQGKYLPKRYAMVWPRQDLINWADA